MFKQPATSNQQLSTRLRPKSLHVFSSVIMIFFTVLFFNSCAKDDLVLDHSDDYELENRETKFPDDTKIELIETLIGEELNNPFTKSNLLKALDSLCHGTDTLNIPIEVTDKLIEFKPGSFDDVKQLFRDTSLVIFDFPPNRRIIRMGDYYGNRTQTNDFPSYYSFVSADQAFPKNMQYTIIEEYAYLNDQPLLIAESFRITDNFEHVNDYLFPEDIIVNNGDICGKVLPPVIDCPEGCIPVLVIDDSQPGVGGRPQYTWECDCDPNNGGGYTQPMNDCGCPTYSDKRKPAGCVTVENTTTHINDGVRKARVTIKDEFFGLPYSTWTDEDPNEKGCWKINKRCKRNIWMWIDFINEDSYERCYVPEFNDIMFGVGGVILDYLSPVRYHHTVNQNETPIPGPNFSNLDVHFPHWAAVGTREQIHWGAATVNNQVQEFNKIATDNLIYGLPELLDIYMMPHRGSGMALMASWGTLGVLGLSSVTLAPDLMIGLDVLNRQSQDRLSFHEMAHASHFSKVGIVWWEGLIAAEYINATSFNLTTFEFEGNPNGDGDLPTDGLIAIAESWAENIERDFTGVDREGIIFEDGYIPMGLFNDLEDTGNADDIIAGIIRDNVSGFTRGEMFNALTGSLLNVNDYRENLRPSLPPGNTMTNYDNLFDDYIP